ncbi:DUF177 domain-containing protein [Chloroflexota bacterium]
MRFNVARLLKGPIGASRQYDLGSDVRHLDSELEPLRPVVGSVTLLRTSQGILAKGNLKTRLKQGCRRCLEPCEVDVEIRLEEEFRSVSNFGGAAIDEALDEELDEALLIDDKHTLDLSEVVRQELLLAATGEAVCHPDCAGLCSTCGGNLNLGECACEEDTVDPRWSALQSLLPHQSESTERRE